MVTINIKQTIASPKTFNNLTILNNELKKYANKNIITTQVNLPLLKAMANLEYKSGLLQDALADYKQALSIEIDPQVCLRIGVILTTLQQYAEATEYYSKANALYNDIKALSLKN